MNSSSVISKNICLLTNNDLKHDINLNGNGTVAVYHGANGNIQNHTQRRVDSQSSDNSNDVITCSRKMQYIASFTANICNLTAGFMYGWSSPALQHVNYTADQKSWIASMMMIGGVLGCIITSLVIDRIGRKITIIGTTIPYITSWIMIYFCMEHVHLLYVARFIGGMGVGAALCVLPMYIGEVVDDVIRGAMGSLLDIFLSLGILIEYCIGPYVSWETLALISLSAPVLNLLCAPMIPESPYFYLMKNKWDDAERSLQVLKNRKDVQKELMILNEMVTREMQEKQGIMKLFTKFANRKAALIMFGLMTFQQFSGIGPVLSYTEDIFRSAGGQVDPQISTIVVGIAQLAACLVSGLVADHWGRRKLLLSSSIGSAICLFATGLIFFMQEVLNEDLKIVADFSIVTLVLYIILVNAGLSTQCYVLLSEIFSTNIKAVAVCASNIYMLLFEGVCTKLFEVIKVAANDKYYLSFWIFGLSCCISFVFVWIIVPETKGKSLEEIQIWLNKNKPIKNKKSKKQNVRIESNNNHQINGIKTISSECL